MGKNEFLKRCGTAWDAGYVKPEYLHRLRDVLELVMRFEGGQISQCTSIMEREFNATEGLHRLLAGDTELYGLLGLAYLLCHPCGKCAHDPKAWHTRYAYCNHEEAKK